MKTLEKTAPGLLLVCSPEDNEDEGNLDGRANAPAFSSEKGCGGDGGLISLGLKAFRAVDGSAFVWTSGSMYGWNLEKWIRNCGITSKTTYFSGGRFWILTQILIYKGGKC